MQYQELVELMSRLDAQRLTLTVHPDDQADIAEAIRRIGDEALAKGTIILAPNIVVSDLVKPGQILIWHPKKEAPDGR